MAVPIRYSEFFFLVTYDFRRLCSRHFITKILGTLLKKTSENFGIKDEAPLEFSNNIVRLLHVFPRTFNRTHQDS